MKIVYVYPQFILAAGTERILIDKMNFLAEQEEYDISLFTIEQGDNPFVFSLSPKVKHIDLDVRYCDLYKLNRINRLFKIKKYNRMFQHRYDDEISKINPDIVITTTYDSRILSVINNCPIRYKRVLESHIGKRYLHQNDPYNHRNIFSWLNAYLGMLDVERQSRKFDVLVALNQADADDWSKYLRTEVIPNIVHLNPTGRYSKLDNRQVIFVGRYSKQKGIENLLKIWSVVYEKHPDWHLEMYGTGEQQEYVLSYVSKNHNNIFVNKPTSNIFEKYTDSSILLMTSLYEPFGLVIPEAMSCGLPVVAFDCPYGPGTIITDSYNGFLIAPSNHKQFVDKVCELMDSYELRKRMGENAITSSLRYSPNNIMHLWKKLFNDLIS